MALRGLDLEIAAKQMCAVMGPSGSGKSTLLHAAAGLTPVDEGEIIIGGRKISRMGEDELSTMRLRDVGIVFQFFNLIPYLTAEENVAFPLEVDAYDTAECGRRIKRALELVRMDHRAKHFPAELSGGEAQRIAIARALVIEPTLLLADEPTGNLDSTATESILELLRELNDATGVTMLVVTHDHVCAAACDRFVRIVDGVVSEDVRMETPDSAGTIRSIKKP